MGVVGDDFFKLDQRCIHCGEPCPRGSKFCKYSNTAAAREEMNAANKEIFEKAGLTFVPPQV